MRGWFKPALLLAAAVAAGCADDPDPLPKPPRPEFVRDCQSRVEGPRLDPKQTQAIVAGPIIFHGLQGAARQPHVFARYRGGRYGSWKTVVAVRAGHAATLVAIGPRAGLYYNLTAGRVLNRFADYERSVRFEACPADMKRASGPGPVGPYTQFNGGFASAGVGCRSFVVYPDRGAKPIRFRTGFGTRERRC